MGEKIARKVLLDDAVERLTTASIGEARRNAEWLLCEVLACSRAELYTSPDVSVSAEERDRFEALLQRRMNHEPLQYIIGYTDFYRVRIRLTPAVLIPRPETEQLVEKALMILSNTESPFILDIGTGSGCIALALKHERPDASVWACDISPEALEVARVNAASNALDVNFFQGDVRTADFLTRAPRDLHLLISNPPYVPESERDSLAPEVRDFEPEVAVFAGDDPLLFYRRIARAGKDLIRSAGWIAFETHTATGPLAGEILASEGYSEVALERDYAGHYRILYGRRGD